MGFFDVISKKNKKEDKPEETVAIEESEEKSVEVIEDETTESYADIIDHQKHEIDKLFEEQEAREALANKEDKNHEEATQNHKNSIDSLFEEAAALENEKKED